jgi:hypothetical protein
MKYPILIADNFFQNLAGVKDYALSINDREIAVDGAWPGERSKPMHLFNSSFFQRVCSKIIATMYPSDWRKISFIADQRFQFIKPNNYDLGFIHTDHQICDFTAIIYLSSHEDCGTNFYSLKKEFFPHANEEFNFKKEISYTDLNNQKKRKEAHEACIENNKFFNETIRVNSKPNRMVIFDAHHFHSSQSFKDIKNKEEDRLTLITFFRKIFFKEDQLLYPLIESNSIL